MYILSVKNNCAERNSNLGHKMQKTDVCFANVYLISKSYRITFINNRFCVWGGGFVVVCLVVL